MKDRRLKEQESEIKSLKDKLEVQGKHYSEMQEDLGKTKAENDRLRREKVEAMDEKQKLQYNILDIESRLRAANKLQEERDKEFERCTREKYDAQNRQFLLQQEYNEHTSKQLDALRMNSANGYDVQKRLIEQQRQYQLVDQAANR
jgi:septal ring factor EnvC (AmiA/AmiB activator)